MLPGRSGDWQRDVDSHQDGDEKNGPHESPKLCTAMVNIASVREGRNGGANGPSG